MAFEVDVGMKGGGGGLSLSAPGPPGPGFLTLNALVGPRPIFGALLTLVALRERLAPGPALTAGLIARSLRTPIEVFERSKLLTRGTSISFTGLRGAGTVALRPRPAGSEFGRSSMGAPVGV